MNASLLQLSKELEEIEDTGNNIIPITVSSRALLEVQNHLSHPTQPNNNES